MRAGRPQGSLDFVSVARRGGRAEIQPRPATGSKGTPIGGQWIVDPSSARQQALRDGRVQVAQIVRNPGFYQIDLAIEEYRGPPNNRGHTIARHVGKSAEELADLLSRTYEVQGTLPDGTTLATGGWGWGSFKSVERANFFVSEVLRNNPERVEAVVAGKNGDSIEMMFTEPTGLEAYWTEPTPPPSTHLVYGVVVVIRNDPHAARGYRVLTAYPLDPNKPRILGR